MSVLEIVLIALAGLAAGTINTIVGSGTLITFPTLLFFGFPPIAANMSNNIGLVAGGISGSAGYRAELKGAGPTMRRLLPMSLIGSVIGALLLRVLPEGAFAAIVPALIGIGLILVVFGPRLQRSMARRRESVAAAGGAEPRWHTPALMAGVLVAGIYGGYFGAAQGIILVGLLSVLTTEGLQRLNGYKNVLGLVVNAVAAAVFIVIGRDIIDWRVVLLIGVGSFVGGIIGATVGRKLPPPALRGFIVVVGVVGIVRIVFFP